VWAATEEERWSEPIGRKADWEWAGSPMEKASRGRPEAAEREPRRLVEDERGEGIEGEEAAFLGVWSCGTARGLEPARRCSVEATRRMW